MTAKATSSSAWMPSSMVGQPQLHAAHTQRGASAGRRGGRPAAPRSPRGRQGRSATRASRRRACAGPPRPGVSPSSASTNASADVVPPHERRAGVVADRRRTRACARRSRRAAPGSHPRPRARAGCGRPRRPPGSRRPRSSRRRGRSRAALTTVPPTITVRALSERPHRAVTARRSAGAGCSRRSARAAPARPGRSRTARPCPSPAPCRPRTPPRPGCG